MSFSGGSGTGAILAEYSRYDNNVQRLSGFREPSILNEVGSMRSTGRWFEAAKRHVRVPLETSAASPARKARLRFAKRRVNYCDGTSAPASPIGSR